MIEYAKRPSSGFREKRREKNQKRVGKGHKGGGKEGEKKGRKGKSEQKNRMIEKDDHTPPLNHELTFAQLYSVIH